MTDHDFEQRLRDWFREEVDETKAAPIALRHSLSAITSEGRHGIFDSRRWMLLAAAALIAMLVAVSRPWAVDSSACPRRGRPRSAWRLSAHTRRRARAFGLAGAER